MSSDTSTKFDLLTLSEAELVDQACERFETAWRAGDWPCIEAYLDAVAEPCRDVLLHELLKLELELRMKVGELPTAQEYRVRFPDAADAVDEICRRAQEPENGQSTAIDQTLGPGATHADDVRLDALTKDLDPGRLADLGPVDGALGRLVGEYVILDRLGSGGMGVVYRAFQRGAGRPVALKLIKTDWRGESTDGSNHEAEIRFQHEAKALARLEHDHIVPLYDVGHADGLLFFSMRLINGRSLGQMVLSDGPLPPRRAAYYVEAIARAVQYAHDHHVLHRDIKPGNILVDENDRPYLIDLGLAKSLEATDYTTLTGKVMGTAEYMSPEQAKDAKDVKAATDVYGLGATLFTLLTGRPPFAGPTPVAVLRKVIDEEPAWPRERDKPVGRELKAICLKCLEKNPSQRIPSAGELATELKKYLMYERCSYTLPGPGTRLIKWVRRQPWRAAAAGLAFVALSIMAFSWAWISHRDRTNVAFFLNDLQKIQLADLPPRIGQMASHRGSLTPRLRKLLGDSPSQSEARSRVLLALLPGEPERAGELADRLLSCEVEEHWVIREALREHWQRVAPKIHQTLANPRSEPGRRIRAAAALIAMDSPTVPAGTAWSQLRLAQDPGARVELMEWLVQSKIDPEVLTGHLESERDPSIRLAAILCLADLDGDQPAEPSLASITQLIALYRQDQDSGVHSSIAYLLRKWGRGDDVKRIDQELTGKPNDSRRWYVNSQGHTMAVIGDDDLASRLKLSRRFSYRFAIATTETTFRQYLKFDPKHRARRASVGLPESSPDAPVEYVTYDEAAGYCNWLSKQEGLPQEQLCYVPGDARGGMLMAPDYLSRRGYRLPNLEEWEYAARAGTSTDRYFGQSLDHATRYVWYRRNTSEYALPVGLKRPNDFGLFDVIGNVVEWCYNPSPPHNQGCDCNAARGDECLKIRLVSLRGGSFRSPEPLLGAKANSFALDLMIPSTDRWHYYGFRVAKVQR
jgi:serine/threonine-protein kinase